MNSHRHLQIILPFLLLTASLVSNALAQTDAAPQKLTEEQLLTIRDRLQAIVTETREATFQKNTSLTQVFHKASESPRDALAFYLESVEEVDFLREGRTGTEFRTWKERNEGRLNDDHFAQGLQILLRYLAISTEAARTSDMAQIFPLLTQYIDGLASMSEPPHGVLNDPIYASIFAKRYEIFDDLQRNDADREGDGRRSTGEEREPAPGNIGVVSWEPRPINVGGMYEKTILPYLHQTSPDKVANAWTKRIDQEGRIAVLQGDAATERFRTRTLPTLQWQMMIDQYQAGYQVSAVTKMLEHIETYKSTHPDAGKWVNQAIGLLFADTDMFASPSPPTPAPAAPAPFEGVKIGD